MWGGGRGEAPGSSESLDIFKGRNALWDNSAWGPGARLKAPVGSRGQSPGGGPGAKPPEALGFSVFEANKSLKLNDICKVGVQGAKPSEALRF